MEGKPPTTKGRGAKLIEAIRKAQEIRPGKEPSEASTSEPPPPKPRGRAALLQKLVEAKHKQPIGIEPCAGTSATSISESERVTPETETRVSRLAESLAASTISTPCSYLGSSGSSVNITANYIRLSVEAERGVFEYDLRFEPQIDSKGLRVRILNMHMPKMGGVKVFDGGSCLYLPIKLPEVITIFTSQHPNDDHSVTMIVTFKKKKRLGECIHLYNVLFKRIMNALMFTRVGRNHFDPHHSHMIPQHKLEVLPGYCIAVDEYEGGVMLCLDTQHRVLRTQSVYDVLCDLRLTCKERFKEAAFKSLIGSCILTRYNNKTYKIDEILWDITPKNTFKTQTGEDISYIHYYKKQHDIDIKDINQPLLLNKVTRKKAGSSDKEDFYICLVPELCFMTGLTDEMRSDFKVMKDVAQYTRVTPNQRLKAMMQYIKNVRNNPQSHKILGEWGLKLEDGSIDLQARVLSPETIIFGGNNEAISDKADWNNVVCKYSCLGPVDLKRWVIFYTARDTNYARDFAQNMCRLTGPMGINVNKPELHELRDDRTNSYIEAINAVVSADIQVLVFICPTSRDDRYAAIKRKCCTSIPIATQVINSRTLSNPQKVRSITQKIALQINCKLGGTLWMVRFPVKTWMVIGIDVYHSQGNKSVCGFVGSLNENFTRWFSITIFQERELGNQLKVAFAKLLERFHEINGTFPQKIIIFRDGVGDGQLAHCRDYEVAQFEECLKKYELDNTKICMVVVQKRINTRLFLKSRDGLENPPPGTIMDSQITRRNWYDFFLVPQNVRQGTVTPSHYVVVYDACQIKPDHMQMLAYKLCHLYYNWPGTIRVPAPCQYAHKLAQLVGIHIRSEPSNKLMDRLYYL
ncbi:piwi-like protein Ago3 [Agrilus planipennis]|uniref:Argonaute-3 n=1 Tax=Agrilus planipennis TaxID=224129 RepID=A0A0B5FZ79_AGRPL|nr:piwi-like protein Ago3 [Agrilus planipennis]AJF15706.1 argonaute-3 [Agrilus planipennis]